MTQRLLTTCLALVFALSSGCGSDDSEPSATGGTAGSGGVAGQGGSGGTAGAGGPLALAAGEAAEVTLADGKGALHLAAPAGDEQFVLVLASEKLDDSSEIHDYAVTLGGSFTDSPASVVSGCSLTPEKWKALTLAPETPPSGTGPAVGTEKSLDVSTKSGKETITVKALAVGDKAVVWGDVTAAHPAVIDPAVVQEFLTDFEKTILPRARGIFGVESDLDKDGHVGLVFSPLVYDTAVAFFTPCDLSPSLGCPSGNQGEYLYLTPPNAIPPPYNTPNAIKEILAHELSHMIHFNRKVLKNATGGSNESAYMHEGIGALAQDVLGYQSGNLYVTKAGLDQIDDYSLADTVADGVQYDLNRDGALRGGSYLFARWFYDRAGGDAAKSDGSVESQGGPALLRTVLDAAEPISTVLPTEAGASLEALAMDFWTTLAMSNREDAGGAAAKNPCFAYLPTVKDPVTTRQRGANLFAKFHGTQEMTGPKLQAAASADGKLRSGGAELLLLEASSGQTELAVSVSAPAGAKPRLRVARVR